MVAVVTIQSRVRRMDSRTASRRLDRRVYRRRRIVAVGAAVSVVLAAWVGVHDLVSGGRDGLGPAREISARVYVVKPGDTLWSIAITSGAKGDIRPVVDALSSEVHGQPLQVGERLTLP